MNNHCREPIAEKVNDKTRSNFCGYFTPAEIITADKTMEQTSNEASLESLFGLEQGSTGLSADSGEQSRQELDALFGLGDKKDQES